MRKGTRTYFCSNRIISPWVFYFLTSISPLVFLNKRSCLHEFLTNQICFWIALILQWNSNEVQYELNQGNWFIISFILVTSTAWSTFFFFSPVLCALLKSYIHMMQKLPWLAIISDNCSAWKASYHQLCQLKWNCALSIWSRHKVKKTHAAYYQLGDGTALWFVLQSHGFLVIIALPCPWNTKREVKSISVTCILGRSDCDCIEADMFDICHAQKYGSDCHNINFSPFWKKNIK